MGPVCRDLKFGAGSIQNTDKCEVRELLGSVLSRGDDAQIHLLARAIQLCWGKQSALRCAECCEGREEQDAPESPSEEAGAVVSQGRLLRKPE